MLILKPKKINFGLDLTKKIDVRKAKVYQIKKLGY